MIVELIQTVWPRKIFIAVFTLAVMLLTVAVLQVTPKTYEALAVIRIIQLNEPTSGIPQNQGMIEKMSLIETHRNLIVSRKVLQRVIEQHPQYTLWANVVGKPHGMESAVRRLYSAVTLEPIKFTDLLEVIVRTGNRREVALIANDLLAAYQEWLDEENALTYQNLTQFLEKQVDLAKEKMEQAEEAIRTYGEAHSLVAIENEMKAKQEVVSGLDVELADLDSKIEYYQELLRRIDQQPEQVASFTGLTTDERVKELIRAYDQNNLQLRVSTKYFKPNHPKYLQLLDKKKSLQQELTHQLKTGYQATILQLQVGRENKRNELEKYRTELSDLANKDQSYERLKRDLKTNEEMYLNLLNKFEASELLQAKKSLVEVITITPASEPEKAVLPKRKRSLIFGTIFGFGLACLIALLRARKTEILKFLAPKP